MPRKKQLKRASSEAEEVAPTALSPALSGAQSTSERIDVNVDSKSEDLAVRLTDFIRVDKSTGDSVIELPTGIHQRVGKLIDKANAYVGRNEWLAAAKSFYDAYVLLPPVPRAVFPVSVTCCLSIGDALYLAGQYDNALRWCKRAQACMADTTIGGSIEQYESENTADCARWHVRTALCIIKLRGMTQSAKLHLITAFTLDGEIFTVADDDDDADVAEMHLCAQTVVEIQQQREEAQAAYHPPIPDDKIAQFQLAINHAKQLQTAAAYISCLSILPQPREQFKESTELFLSAGHFSGSGNMLSAYHFLRHALICPPNTYTNFGRYRLGQAALNLFEQTQRNEYETQAAKYLVQALREAGPSLFSKDNPKYLRFAQEQIRPKRKGKKKETTDHDLDMMEAEIESRSEHQVSADIRVLVEPLLERAAATRNDDSTIESLLLTALSHIPHPSNQYVVTRRILVQLADCLLRRHKYMSALQFYRHAVICPNGLGTAEIHREIGICCFHLRLVLPELEWRCRDELTRAFMGGGLMQPGERPYLKYIQQFLVKPLHGWDVQTLGEWDDCFEAEFNE